MLLFPLVQYFIVEDKVKFFCQRCIFHIIILLISYMCASKASATLILPKSLIFMRSFVALSVESSFRSSSLPLFKKGGNAVPPH